MNFLCFLFDFVVDWVLFEFILVLKDVMSEVFRDLVELIIEFVLYILVLVVFIRLEIYVMR